MKYIIFSLAITAIVLTACTNSSNQTGNTKENDLKSDSLVSHSQSVADTTASQIVSVNNTPTFSSREIITDYLQLKNALAKDNSKDAATAGNAIVAALEKVDMKSLPEAQMKSYTDIADDLKENAEHIGANPDNIKHQREHFEMLSKDISDIIKIFGNGGQTLYRDFCPMTNNGKGATWISEIKEIKNPYLGSEMPDCGSIKETIK